jgi:hypothetical protein
MSVLHSHCYYHLTLLIWNTEDSFLELASFGTHPIYYLSRVIYRLRADRTENSVLLLECVCRIIA